MHRVVLSGVFVGLTFGGFLANAPLQAETGLSKTKPASGRYVKTERGYMVPYKMAIPGTTITFEMVPIPGGTFRLGSPQTEASRSRDEGPQRTIKVAPFWMGKHEITWAEYTKFMELYAIFKEFKLQKMRLVKDGNKLDAITAPTELYEPSFTYKKGQEPNQPAVTMTQYAAKQYTKWLSRITGLQFRLPSEAEWEYACRAGSRTAFHFGDDPSRLGQYAWYAKNSGEKLNPVGTKKPNPWGLHDMHGNVHEWVLDEYDEKGYTRLKKGPLTAAEAIVWPTKLYPRVVRGGSWADPPARCRSAARLQTDDDEWKSRDPNFPLSPWWFTSDPARGVGFRLVRPLKRVSRKEMERYWKIDCEDIQFDVENRLEEGRGAIGLVDPQLPQAIEQLKKKKRKNNKK